MSTRKLATPAWSRRGGCAHAGLTPGIWSREGDGDDVDDEEVDDDDTRAEPEAEEGVSAGARCGPDAGEGRGGSTSVLRSSADRMSTSRASCSGPLSRGTLGPRPRAEDSGSESKLSGEAERRSCDAASRPVFLAGCVAAVDAGDVAELADGGEEKGGADAEVGFPRPPLRRGMAPIYV